MQNTEWEAQFKETFNRGVRAWQEGRKSPETMYTDEDASFLTTIGYTKQELFDFVDDYLRYGEPGFATALEVAKVRYEYFLKEMKGVPSSSIGSMDALPPKTVAVEGIVWLPRIMVKARLKLRGEMPPELMYGCGGDRQFLKESKMTQEEFLRLVWDSRGDDKKIIERVKEKRGGK